MNYVIRYKTQRGFGFLDGFYAQAFKDGGVINFTMSHITYRLYRAWLGTREEAEKMSDFLFWIPFHPGPSGIVSNGQPVDLEIAARDQEICIKHVKYLEEAGNVYKGTISGIMI